MSLIMTKQEREAFLADVHVGIISISEAAWRAPSFLPKRRISSAICAPSPAVISEKSWATAM